MPEPVDLSAVPIPEDPDKRDLALALGSIVLQGMSDVYEMEKFSGGVGRFDGEISDPDGEIWILTLVRV